MVPRINSENPRTPWKVNNEESSESVDWDISNEEKRTQKQAERMLWGWFRQVVDIWIIKGGVGDDSNEEGCGGSAVNCEQYDGSDDSGEEYDGSEEELTSDAVGIDDEEFDNNIDVNVERRESVTAVQVQQVAHVQQEFHVQQEPQVQEEAQVQHEAQVQEEAQVQHEAQVQEEAQVQQEAQPDVITQPEMEDTQWEIPDDILDAHWHQVIVQSEGIEGGNSLTTTNRIAVQELGQDQHAQSVQQGMASVEAARGIQGPSRGKQVKPPKKSSRNKLLIKRYGTRSGSFRSLFFGNDKDPINLD
nr:leucine zipper putative tumor suppressor 3 [Ipomoea batatas]